jgi:hypothetical protein
MSAEQWFMPLFGISVFCLGLFMFALVVGGVVAVFRDPRLKGDTRSFWRALVPHRPPYSTEMLEEVQRDIRQRYFATRLGGVHSILLALFFSLAAIVGLCELIDHLGAMIL